MPNKTRACGTWTEAKFKSFIVSALRGATMRWKPKNECIRNARTRRGFYRCNICKEEVPATLPPLKGNKKRRKNIFADHIKPIVDPLVGFVDWNTWINRAFVELDGYQAACLGCHAEKTKEEKAIAKNRRT